MTDLQLDSGQSVSFAPYVLSHGLIADMSDDPFPTRLSAWSNDSLRLDGDGTHFGYVHSGKPVLHYRDATFALLPGMYFSLPGAGYIGGPEGEGIIISRLGYNGFFHVGGPVEEFGRLKYIDGCTDSLLVPPILLGDPCLNLLYFPPGVRQTQHTHPSMRVGIVILGKGMCVTPSSDIPLVPGTLFVIPKDGRHGFSTFDSPMTVIAYHPDSDYGPTHEVHPMINRTIVDGTSASFIPEIRTK